MSWSSELPGELLCQPLGLVVLTGLDVTYNAVHKAIWDCFCNNRRPDRVPLQFRVLGLDHEYPKCRSKRTSYEWYIPKGIVKTSWMRKHLEQIPAVVVIFFDLDWDENMWKERQMECATRVEIVRGGLAGRCTRVAVVLIQKTAPLPPGEDVVAAERAASLCTACDLSAKSLFVLPHTDHLLGYTIRLENAFYELAQSYYHSEARRVKAHKEFLNKTTHQLLFVRHQFKIAFYNELKQDTHTGLKHYKQAYGHVLDLRMHDTNLLECKTIGGFVNYKICRLSFQHNAPLDAIAQFRRHIDFFKNRVGIQDLSFEHSAWMSKQFQVFGDLFDEAIKLGLTAIQTQHPGFYYQQAANHSSARKQLCHKLCNCSLTAPPSDPLEYLSNLDYYGQRPWRQGHQSIDPPDSAREKDGIIALQLLELSVDHSWIIIPLLTCAVAQFKKYKSSRMKRFLMVQMGEEYYCARDYAKALTLLSRVTWDYRSEHWWPLLTNILNTALRCAYLTASVQEYVSLCMELVGTYTLCSEDDRTRIQTNLIRVMSCDVPEPEANCDAESMQAAEQMWTQEMPRSGEPQMFTIEMQSIVPFVECKAQFISAQFTADKNVRLKVYLRSHAPYPIRFSKLSVMFNNQAYNEYCVLHDVAGSGSPKSVSSGGAVHDLYLTPGKVMSHAFSFLTQPVDVGNVLEITSVALNLGSEKMRCAVLHWSGGGGDAVAPSDALQKQCHKRTDCPSDQYPITWSDIDVLPHTNICARESQVDVSLLHEPPSLVNEFYLIKVFIVNNENCEISDVTLSAGLKEGQDAQLEMSTHVSADTPAFNGQPVSHITEISLGDFTPGQQLEKKIYVKSLQTGDRMLTAKVTYNIVVETEQATPIQCVCVREQTVILPNINPLDVTVRITNMQFDEQDGIHADEPFLLLSDIRCLSPWQLELGSSKLELSTYMQNADEGSESNPSQLTGISLQPRDQASECRALIAPPAIQTSIPMGTYSIMWRRKSSDVDIPYVQSTVVLPTIAISHVPLYISAELPAFGHVRARLPVVYNVYNRTAFSQEVEVSIEPSDAFMFAGHKQVHFRILPAACYKLSYSMYPLMPGNISLPRLHINMIRCPGTMDELTQKMLPKQVYIKPSGKREGLIQPPGEPSREVGEH